MRQGRIRSPDIEMTHIVLLETMLTDKGLKVGIVDANFVLFTGHRILIGKDIVIGHNSHDILVWMIECRVRVVEDDPH